MKQCTVCQESKSFDQFYKNKLTKDGRGSQCKSCDSLEKARISRDKKKILVDLMGGKCSNCGYNKSYNALDFHHLRDKEFSISEKMRYDIEILKEESKKCVLLCANCHREHHDNEYVENRNKKLCFKI